LPSFWPSDSQTFDLLQSIRIAEDRHLVGQRLYLERDAARLGQRANPLHRRLDGRAQVDALPAQLDPALAHPRHV